MVKINLTDHSGTTRTVDVEAGATVMEGAIRNAIPGIEAECGGACACATCHVYVDEAWREDLAAYVDDLSTSWDLCWPRIEHAGDVVVGDQD